MYSHISNFILQSKTTNLKSSQYPKEYLDLDVKFSFGMGTPAKISWASIHNNEIRNTKGINCVYLYYKEENILILAYGVRGKPNQSNIVPCIDKSIILRSTTRGVGEHNTLK